MVNFEWYRTFVTIYQQGNLTKAANELFISQPNVSNHLASLEQYVGGKLFERMPRRVVPTELGNKLYAEIIGSIENLTSVEHSFVKKEITSLPLIRLGAPIEYFYTCVADNFQDIPFYLNVTFGLANELITQLSIGNLDVVIASQKETDNNNILYVPLLKEQFVVITHKDIDSEEFNILVNNNDLIAAEKWLLKQPCWYAYSSNLAYIRRFWLKNFNKRPQIDPKFIIPNLNTIIKSIAESEGISIVSDFLVEKYKEKDKLTVLWKGNVEATNMVYLAYDKTKISSNKIEEILKFVSYR